MNSRLTKHLKTKEQKEEFEKRILGCKDVLEVISNLLEEDLRKIDKDSLNKEHYFMPAWSEYQADRNGSKRQLKKILTLLEV